MTRFAANLTMLFTELPLQDRFAAARDAGFDLIEFQLPYALTAAALADAAALNGQQIVMFNFPAGDWPAGDRGLAADPARRQEFGESVAAGLEYAAATGCRLLTCLAGIVPEAVGATRARDCIVENVALAADLAAPAGVQVLLEPVNRFDAPGYALPTTRALLETLASVERANVGISFDAYHVQREQGGLLGALGDCWPWVRHIQIADSPDRHQPGSGDIDFPAFFAHLDTWGYDGVVGLEYRPSPDTATSLDELRRTSVPTPEGR